MSIRSLLEQREQLPEPTINEKLDELNAFVNLSTEQLHGGFEIDLHSKISKKRVSQTEDAIQQEFESKLKKIKKFDLIKYIPFSEYLKILQLTSLAVAEEHASLSSEAQRQKARLNAFKLLFYFGNFKNAVNYLSNVEKNNQDQANLTLVDTACSFKLPLSYFYLKDIHSLIKKNPPSGPQDNVFLIARSAARLKDKTTEESLAELSLDSLLALKQTTLFKNAQKNPIAAEILYENNFSESIFEEFVKLDEEQVAKNTGPSLIPDTQIDGASIAPELNDFYVAKLNPRDVLMVTLGSTMTDFYSGFDVEVDFPEEARHCLTDPQRGGMFALFDKKSNTPHCYTWAWAAEDGGIVFNAINGKPKFVKQHRSLIEMAFTHLANKLVVEHNIPCVYAGSHDVKWRTNYINLGELKLISEQHLVGSSLSFALNQTLVAHRHFPAYEARDYSSLTQTIVKSFCELFVFNKQEWNDSYFTEDALKSVGMNKDQCLAHMALTKSFIDEINKKTLAKSVLDNLARQIIDWTTVFKQIKNLVNPDLRNKKKATVFHIAAALPNADILCKLLEPYAPKKRLAILLANSNGNTPLGVAALRGRAETIIRVLSLLDINDRLVAVNERCQTKDVHSYEKMTNILNIGCQDNFNLLYDMLKLLPEEHRAKALLTMVTPHHLLYRFNSSLLSDVVSRRLRNQLDVDLLPKIITLIPENDRLKVLSDVNLHSRDTSVLYDLLQHNQQAIFLELYRLLPELHRSEALGVHNAANCMGNTLYLARRILAKCNLEQLIEIFSHTSPDEVLQLLHTEQDPALPLRLAINNPDLRVVDYILAHYLGEQQSVFLQMKCSEDGDIPLHNAAIRSFEMFIKILELYPIDQRAKMLEEKNKEGMTALDMATAYNKSDVIKNILKVYEQYGITLATRRDNTLLLRAACNRDKEAISHLAQLYRATYSKKEIRHFFRDKNDESNTILHIAARNYEPEVFDIAFELYCYAYKNPALKIFNHLNKLKQSVWNMLAFNGHKKFMDLLKSLDADKLTQVLHAESDSPLLCAFANRCQVRNGTYLELLKLYKKEERLQAFLSSIKSSSLIDFSMIGTTGKEIHAKREQLFKIVELLSTSDRLAALQGKEYSGTLFDRLLWSFKENTKPFKYHTAKAMETYLQRLLTLLPVEDRLTVLQDEKMVPVHKSKIGDTFVPLLKNLYFLNLKVHVFNKLYPSLLIYVENATTEEMKDFIKQQVVVDPAAAKAWALTKKYASDSEDLNGILEKARNEFEQMPAPQPQLDEKKYNSSSSFGLFPLGGYRGYQAAENEVVRQEGYQAAESDVPRQDSSLQKR